MLFMDAITAPSITLTSTTTSLAASGIISSSQSVGTSSIDGLLLASSVLATAILNQNSPRVHFQGSGWKTNSPAGPQTVDYVMEAHVTTGTASPDINLNFRSQINGAGYTTVATMFSDGSLTLAGSIVTSGVTLFSGNFTMLGLTANGMIYLDGSQIIRTTAAPTNGQLLVGSTGGIPVLATITGTASQVVVTNGTGTITLSTPQNIATNSSPQFSSLTVTSNVGIGPAGSLASSAVIVTTNTMTGASQFVLNMQATITSTATTAGYGVCSLIKTQATSFTCTNSYNFYGFNPALGSGSAVTNCYGYYCEAISSGGTSNFAFFSAGTTPSQFGGAVTVLSMTTGAPAGGTAAAWKMGVKATGTVALDTTKYVQLDVAGTLYKLLTAV